MSYAQKREISGNRTLAIIMVVILQFALGYAIVTGLAYNVIKKAAEDLKTFDVEEPDDRVCRVQDRLRRAVVLLEREDL